jgi:outer membrane protein assembly factor BamD
MKKCLLLGISILFISGCSIFGSDQMNKNAEQLAAEGSSAFVGEDYKDSIKAYTDLKDWYPFSKYAILAELKIADAHFNLEEYDEALVAYDSFERMHPRNEAVPYVINQIGLCWFNQIGTIDRRQMESLLIPMILNMRRRGTLRTAWEEGPDKSLLHPDLVEYIEGEIRNTALD